MIAAARKLSPRMQYRLERVDQVNSSSTLSERFPKLKLLHLTVKYFDSTGTIRNGEMKYTFNLAFGRSLFCFNCVHRDCAGGDYDLSRPLARAIATRRKLVEGELRCQGTRHNQDRKTHLPCQSILRYKLTLGY